ncbi:MAG: S-layer homology domain-containing protein [Clostridiales bacterium]|nr:S-layer homology domain-containing protein [Clostridiales bacterium]
MFKKFVGLLLVIILTMNPLTVFADDTKRGELALTQQLKTELYESVNAQEYPNGLFDFLMPRLSVDEDMEYVEFGIIRRGPADTDASVTFKAMDLTAKYGEDYYIDVPDGSLDTSNAADKTLLEMSASENEAIVLGKDEKPAGENEAAALGGDTEIAANVLTTGSAFDISSEADSDKTDGGTDSSEGETAETGSGADSAENDTNENPANEIYSRLEASAQYGLSDLLELQSKGGALSRMSRDLLGADQAYTDWRGEYPANVTDEDLQTYNEAQAAYDLVYEGMQGVSVRLNFKPGEYMKVLRFIPIADGLSEDSEQIITALLEAEGADLLKNTSGFIDIMDKDEPEEALFSLSQPEIRDGYAHFTLNKTAAIERYATAHIATAGFGGAQAGEDYTAVNQSVMMLPGQTRQQLRIPVSDGGSGSFGVYLTDETYQTTTNLDNAVTFDLGEGENAPLAANAANAAASVMPASVAVSPYAAGIAPSSAAVSPYAAPTGPYVDVAGEFIDSDNGKKILSSGGKYRTPNKFSKFEVIVSNIPAYDMRLFDRVSSDIKKVGIANTSGTVIFSSSDNRNSGNNSMDFKAFSSPDISDFTFKDPSLLKGSLRMQFSLSLYFLTHSSIPYLDFYYSNFEWSYFRLYYRSLNVTTPALPLGYADSIIPTYSYTKTGKKLDGQYAMGRMKIGDAGSGSYSKSFYYNDTVSFEADSQDAFNRMYANKFYVSGLNIKKTDGSGYFAVSGNMLNLTDLALGKIKDMRTNKVVDLNACLKNGTIEVFPIYKARTAFVKLQLKDSSSASVSGYGGYKNGGIIQATTMDEITFDVVPNGMKTPVYSSYEAEFSITSAGSQSFLHPSAVTSSKNENLLASGSSAGATYAAKVFSNSSFNTGSYHRTHTDGDINKGPSPTTLVIEPESNFTLIDVTMSDSKIYVRGYPYKPASGTEDKGEVRYDRVVNGVSVTDTMVYNRDYTVSPLEPNKIYQFFAETDNGYIAEWNNYTGDSNRDGNLSDNSASAWYTQGNDHYGFRSPNGEYIRPGYYGSLFNFIPTTTETLIYYSFIPETAALPGTIIDMQIAYKPSTILGGEKSTSENRLNPYYVRYNGGYYPPVAGAQVNIMGETKITDDYGRVRFTGEFVPRGLYSASVSYQNHLYQVSAQANGPDAVRLIDQYTNFQPSDFKVYKNGVIERNFATGRMSVGTEKDTFTMSVHITPRALEKAGKVWIEIMRPGAAYNAPATVVNTIPMSKKTASNALDWVTPSISLVGWDIRANDYAVLRIESEPADPGEPGVLDFPHEVGLKFEPNLDAVAIDANFTSVGDGDIEFMGSADTAMALGGKAKISSIDGGQTAFISFNMPEIANQAQFDSLKKQAADTAQGQAPPPDVNSKQPNTGMVGNLRYSLNAGMTMAISYDETAAKYYLSDIVMRAQASAGASVKVEVMTPIGITFFATFSGDANIEATMVFSRPEGAYGNYVYTEDGGEPINLTQNASKFEALGTLKVQPSISIAVGADFIKLLKITIEGKVALTMTFKTDGTGSGNVRLTVNTTLTVLGFINFNWNIADKTYNLYSYGGSASRMLSSAMLEGGANLSDSLTTGELSPMPVGVPRWNAAARARVAIGQEQELMREINPNANPVIWDLGGGRFLMVFVGYYEGMNEYNRAALQYSVFNGASWSQPEFVYKQDGRDLYHDEAPALFEAGGRILAVWSRTRAPLTQNMTTLERMNNYDIVTAFFSPATETFDNFQNVTQTTSGSATTNSDPSVAFDDETNTMLLTYRKADYESRQTGEEGEVGDIVFAQSAIAGKYYDFDSDKWMEEYPEGLKTQMGTDGRSYNGEFLLDFTKMHAPDNTEVNTIASGLNPIITEAKLTSQPQQSAIYVLAIVDMDSNLATRYDRELFMQGFSTFGNKGIYGPALRLTEDDVEQSNIRVVETKDGPSCLYLSEGHVIEMNIGHLLGISGAPETILAVSPMMPEMPITEFEAVYDNETNRLFVYWLQREEVNEELGNQDDLGYYLCLAMGDYANKIEYEGEFEGGAGFTFEAPAWSKTAYMGPSSYGNLSAAGFDGDSLKVVFTSNENAGDSPRLLTANINYNDFDMKVEREGGAEKGEIFGGRVSEVLSVKNNSLLRRENLAIALLRQDPQLDEPGTTPAAEVVSEPFTLDGGDTQTVSVEFDLPDEDFAEYWLFVFDGNNAAGVQYGNYEKTHNLNVLTADIYFTGRDTAIVSGTVSNDGDKAAVNETILLRVGSRLIECAPISVETGEAAGFEHEFTFTPADIITEQTELGEIHEILQADILTAWPEEYEQNEIIEYAAANASAQAFRTAGASQIEVFNAVSKWGIANLEGNEITSLNMANGESEFIYPLAELPPEETRHTFRIYAVSDNPGIVSVNGGLVEAAGKGNAKLTLYIYPGSDAQFASTESSVYENEDLTVASGIVHKATLNVTVGDAVSDDSGNNNNGGGWNGSFGNGSFGGSGSGGSGDGSGDGDSGENGSTGGSGADSNAPDEFMELSDSDLAKVEVMRGDGMTVRISAAPLSSLTKMQAAQVKGMNEPVNIAVYDGNTLTEVEMRISLPYKLKPGEAAQGVCAWHISDDGNITKMSGSFNAQTGMISFTANKSGLYAAGYDPTALWVNPFSDVAENSWYYDAVSYVNHYGIFGGYGGGIFAPNEGMTRAMFVTALWSLDGKPEVPGLDGDAEPSGLDGNAEQSVLDGSAELPGLDGNAELPGLDGSADLSGLPRFGDVENGIWYENPVLWAAENGIVSGVGGGSFAPNRAITRQEMVTMMANYAKFKGYTIPENREMPPFTDYDDVAAWAKEPVTALSMAGVINGDNNTFMPEKTATRAEAAQTFKSFMRFVTGK